MNHRTLFTALLCSLTLVLSIPTFKCAFAKTPPSPLYKFQHWAKNTGQKFELRVPLSENKKTKKVEACAGNDINLEEAWDVSTGSKKVTIAILDDGFIYTHRNIVENIWNNPGENGPDKHGLEKATNGIDDDNNGFVDDLHGYNFPDNNGDPHDFIWDVDRDGNGTLRRMTHAITALGIIGAKPNSEFGIAGINWNVSMMLLKVCNTNGVGSICKNRAKNVAAAIRYASDNGAKVINWSGYLSQREFSNEDLEQVVSAIEHAARKNVLIVAAAGNSAIDISKNTATLDFPVSRDFSNVIFVSNVDPCGRLVDFKTRPEGNATGGSNYSKTRAFVAAPAHNAVSTFKNNSYTLTGGTSNAAPMVSGVAALMLSTNPNLGFEEIKNILCVSTTRTEELKEKLKCGGILNAGKAMQLTRSRLQKSK